MIMVTKFAASQETKCPYVAYKILLVVLFSLPLFDAQATSTLFTVRSSVDHEHSRIVLESENLIHYELLLAEQPNRIILDLKNIQDTSAFTQLEEMLKKQNPFFNPRLIRTYSTNQIRLVLEQKTQLKPYIFSLKPDDTHGHRLVLDLYLSLPISKPKPLTAAAIATEQLSPKTNLPQRRQARSIYTQQHPAATSENTLKTNNLYASIAPTRPATRHDEQRHLKHRFEELWLEVALNQERKGITLFLRDAHQRLLASAESFKNWRLKTPNKPSQQYQNQDYYALNELDTLQYSIEEPTQAIQINAPANLFESSRSANMQYDFLTPTLPSAGAFLNYDLSLTHSNDDFNLSGLFELGISTRWGVATNTALWSDRGDGLDLIRLDSTWTYDQPQRVASLRLGDSVTSASTWSRSVRFGGVQWASNFNTQPSFVNYALPSVSGESILPSTLELYVNNALLSRSEVPAGPFTVDNLPVVTGLGEARVLVRDLLGRESLIKLPYYTSTRLLRAGLNEYSYEAGFVRENFSQESNEYGRFLTSASFRRGLSKSLTGEVHAELLEDQASVGLSSAVLWPNTGVISLAVAGSQSGQGTGGLVGLGFERQHSHFSFGINTQWATREFTQLGLATNELAPIQQSQAFANLATGGNSSLSLNYSVQRFRDKESFELIGASYNTNIANIGYLNLSLLHFLRNDSDTIIGLNFTFSLDQRTSASVSASHRENSTEALFQVQRSLPIGPGYGYRALVGNANSGHIEAGYSQQTDFGTYTLEASHLNNQTSARGLASGGVVFIDKNLFFSRRITDSYALVKVADYPNVRVYAENQLVAYTDNTGQALLPHLRAYDKNQISIDIADLPLNANMVGANMVAIPYFRSASVVEFPVTHSLSAVLHAVHENGTEVPAGASAQIHEQSETFPVGRNGFIYLSGLSTRNLIDVRWSGHRCQFNLILPDSDDPLPDLGSYTCYEVAR